MSNYVSQYKFEFRFALNDCVIVDGCESLIMRVVGIQVTPASIMYKLAWFDDRGHTAEWFDDFRVTQSTR